MHMSLTPKHRRTAPEPRRGNAPENPPTPVKKVMPADPEPETNTKPARRKSPTDREAE
jgi:hypothetical protein